MIRNNSAKIPRLPSAKLTTKQAMEQFDALPPRLRHLLNYAPVKLVVNTRYSQARIESEFYNLMTQHFPTWTPEC